MLGAIGVFVIAVVLAFSVNGDDDGAAAVAATESQADPAEAGAESVAQDQAVDQTAPDPATEQEVAQGAAPAESQSAQDAGVAEVEPEPDLTGFIIPIEAACVPEFDGHLPGSPREYRNGTHEGIDFYGWSSCREIDDGTVVLAAKAGTVVRVDQVYTDITVAQFEEATDPAVASMDAATQERFLDRLRGRQVWIDHGAGVVTRYAHLSAVAAGLQVGDEVRAGQVIGFVGESGQLESITAPGTDFHLHFEVRVGPEYLGQGLAPLEARPLYLALFGFEPDSS